MISFSHSSDWLHALPIASCGLRLENEDSRVVSMPSKSYDLEGIGCCWPTSLCRTLSSTSVPLRSFSIVVNGLHGLSCKLGSGKHSRHASINDIISRANCRADIPAVKDSTGLIRNDGKRPVVSTLVPW